MIRVGASGNINGSVGTEVGGVHFQDYVMYVINRGWADDENDGTNKSYYFYNVYWYPFCSPVLFFNDTHSRMFGVRNVGEVASHWVNFMGGVLTFLQICLLY